MVSYNRHMVTSISPQQAQALIASSQVDIVDVREPGEWSTGHLPGARLVPLAELRSNPKKALLRDGAIFVGVIFVCAAGVRSQTAARIADQVGISALYSLTGGTRSWVNAGLPLVQD
jgi:rhodanese-related sulfurtransferase